jgi:hypothetical protein
MIRAVVFDAGECPVAVVGTADQQDLARLVDDDHVDGRDEAASFRRLGGVLRCPPWRQSIYGHLQSSMDVRQLP